MQGRLWSFPCRGVEVADEHLLAALVPDRLDLAQSALLRHVAGGRIHLNGPTEFLEERGCERVEQVLPGADLVRALDARLRRFEGRRAVLGSRRSGRDRQKPVPLLRRRGCDRYDYQKQRQPSAHGPPPFAGKLCLNYKLPPVRCLCIKISSSSFRALPCRRRPA